MTGGRLFGLLASLLACLAAALPAPANAQQGGFFRGVLLPATSVASGSGCFAADMFTGTNGTALTSHTPDKGGAWSYHAAPTNGTFQLDGSGGAISSTIGANGGNAYITAVPPSANYTVRATIVSGGVGGFGGIAGRIDTASDTYYLVAHDGTNWSLAKQVAGSYSTLGSFSPDASFASSGSRDVQLIMSGTTITAKVAGATIASVTDSAISAAGRAGTVFFASGPHITAFSAC